MTEKSKSVNKSQNSVSPASGFKDKFKQLQGKTYDMKRSFTNSGTGITKEKMEKLFPPPKTPEIKAKKGEKDKPG